MGYGMCMYKVCFFCVHWFEIIETGRVVMWDSDVKKDLVIFLDTFTDMSSYFDSKFLVLNLTHNDTKLLLRT